MKKNKPMNELKDLCLLNGIEVSEFKYNHFRLKGKQTVDYWPTGKRKKAMFKHAITSKRIIYENISIQDAVDLANKEYTSKNSRKIPATGKTKTIPRNHTTISNNDLETILATIHNHIELLRNFDNTSEAVAECETLIKRIRK